MDIYIIIFAALAVFILLRLRSVVGQRAGSERPFRVSAFVYRLSAIAFVLGAVNYVAYEAKWYAAIAARVTPITNISRVVDGGTVVILLAMALLLGAALVLSFSALEGMEGPKAGARWRGDVPEAGQAARRASAWSAQS